MYRARSPEERDDFCSLGLRVTAERCINVPRPKVMKICKELHYKKELVNWCYFRRVKKIWPSPEKKNLQDEKSFDATIGA